jgi:4'-phosphopantetheinyl transferase
MKLTPQPWIWDGANPDAAWLAECPADVPVVWQARLTDDPDTQAYLISLLSAAERARLARFHLREDQQRFLAGRGLLRLLVGAHLNTPPERVKFNYGPFGKPFVVPPAGTPALHFNVAHSGKLVLLAFSPVHEVGVDVEEVRRDPDLETIARQVFAADEHRGWLRLNPAERLTAFFRAWIRHEAGLKALGLGFTGERHSALDARLTWFDLALPEGYQGAVTCRRL